MLNLIRDLLEKLIEINRPDISYTALSHRNGSRFRILTTDNEKIGNFFICGDFNLGVQAFIRIV